MAFSEDYILLKLKIASSRCTQEMLNNLKLTFAKDINSKREMELITNLADLIKILEKRMCLSCDKISVLNIIASSIGRRDLVTKAPQPTDNFQVAETIFPRISTDVNKRVFDYICKQIGKDWKDFARNLSISEGEIDELDRHKTIKEKVMQILYYHKNNCEPNTLRTSICDALQETRRNDIRREVNRIYDTHHLMRS